MDPLEVSSALPFWSERITRQHLVEPAAPQHAALQHAALQLVEYVHVLTAYTALQYADITDGLHLQQREHVYSMAPGSDILTAIRPMTAYIAVQYEDVLMVCVLIEAEGSYSTA